MKLPRRGALAAGRGTDGGKGGSPRGPSTLPMRPQAGQPAGHLEPHPAPRRQVEALRLSVVSSEATHTWQGPCERQGKGTGGAGARRASRGLAGHGPPGMGPQQQLQHQLQSPRSGLSGPAPLPWQRLGVARAGGGYRPHHCQGAQAEQALATHPGHLDASGQAVTQGEPRWTLPHGPACPLQPFWAGRAQGEPRRTLPRGPACPLQPLLC